ncbi:adhesion G protein-coupled receptor E5-like isoform X2 [Halichondria panicea]
MYTVYSIQELQETAHRNLSGCKPCGSATLNSTTKRTRSININECHCDTPSAEGFGSFIYYDYGYHHISIFLVDLHHRVYRSLSDYAATSNCTIDLCGCASDENNSSTSIYPEAPEQNETFCGIDCRAIQNKEENCSSFYQDVCSEWIIHPYMDYNIINHMEFSKCCFESINCLNVSLFETDCTTNSSGRDFTCDRICQRGDLIDSFLEDCPFQRFDFCDPYLQNVLDIDDVISEDDFVFFIEFLEEYIESVNPENIVNTLDNLFTNLMDSSEYLLDNDNNTELILGIFEELFDDAINQNWTDQLNSATVTVADSKALSQVESLGAVLGSRLANGNRTNPFSFSGTNMMLTMNFPSQNRSLDNQHRISIQGVSSRIRYSTEVNIPLKVLCSSEGCSSVVSLASVNNLAAYLHEGLVRRQRKANNVSQYASYMPATPLLSAQIFGVTDIVEQLKTAPIQIVTTLDSNNLTMREFMCVFWNENNKSWSHTGVTTDDNGNNTITCTTTHLTSFAILVSVNEVSTNPLDLILMSTISYIGCVISIICLLATIFCLIAFKKFLKKGPLLYVHLNLAIALLLGYTVFVLGVDTAKGITVLCTIVAAVIQYFFLASFCWMLSEAVMLYLLVVKVFGSAAKRWYWLLILGWGVPLPIVAISAGVLRMEYGNNNSCWINRGPAVYTFVGPMLLIILINTVILILTVVSIVRGKKFGGGEVQVKTRTLVKTTLQSTVILLPLLGITWVIGLFAVNENTQVFAWLFILTNSFQGMFIFVFHVLRNEYIIRRLKFCCCKTRVKKTTENKTSAMKLEGKSAVNKTYNFTLTTEPYTAEYLDNENCGVTFSQDKDTVADMIIKHEL